MNEQLLAIIARQLCYMNTNTMLFNTAMSAENDIKEAAMAELERRAETIRNDIKVTKRFI